MLDLSKPKTIDKIKDDEKSIKQFYANSNELFLLRIVGKKTIKYSNIKPCATSGTTLSTLENAKETYDNKLDRSIKKSFEYDFFKVLPVEDLTQKLYVDTLLANNNDKNILIFSNKDSTTFYKDTVQKKSYKLYKKFNDVIAARDSIIQSNPNGNILIIINPPILGNNKGENELELTSTKPVDLVVPVASNNNVNMKPVVAVLKQNKFEKEKVISKTPCPALNTLTNDIYCDPKTHTKYELVNDGNCGTMRGNVLENYSKDCGFDCSKVANELNSNNNLFLFNGSTFKCFFQKECSSNSSVLIRFSKVPSNNSNFNDNINCVTREVKFKPNSNMIEFPSSKDDYLFLKEKVVGNRYFSCELRGKGNFPSIPFSDNTPITVQCKEKTECFMRYKN